MNRPFQGNKLWKRSYTQCDWSTLYSTESRYYSMLWRSC